MLAGMLRNARLTLLTGVAGAGKTCLLREALWPRLARREGDLPRGASHPIFHPPVPAHDLARTGTWDEAPETREPPGTWPDDPTAWTERRQHGAAGAEPGSREVAVYMDAWDQEAPLEALRRRLCLAFGRPAPGVETGPQPAPSLRELVDELCGEHDARLLVVLDAFEAFLKLPPTEQAAADFAREWAEVVNRPGLPVHFLVCMRQEAQALLERFQPELPALACNWVGLLPVPVAAAPEGPPEGAEGAPSHITPVAATARDTAPETLPPVEAISSEEVCAAEPVALRSPAPWPLQPGAEWPRPEPAGSDRSRGGRLLLAGALTLIVVASALLWWRASKAPDGGPALSRPQGPPASTGAAVASPAAGSSVPPAEAAGPAVPAPTAPGWRIQTGPGQRTDAQVAQELQRSLEARLPAGEALPLQIVHHDALEAARAAPEATLRVIGPLFPEELQLVVRADSALRFIHQIRGQRIGTTLAADGGPTGTADLLYRRLFGQRLAQGQLHAAPWPKALAELQAGRTDLLLLVDGEPSAWWSELSAQERRGLRLLSLDPAAPQTRQVLQSFLPVRMALPEGLGLAATPAAGPGRSVLTLAVMSFLTTTAPPAADPALRGMVRAWCQALPDLRRNGHPKWRAAQPWLPLGVGGPPVPGVRELLGRCAPTPAALAVQPPPGQAPARPAAPASPEGRRP